jgi:hypothetical protein
MSDKIKHVTDSSFNSEVLQSPIPVLVDYSGDWISPKSTSIRTNPCPRDTTCVAFQP